MVSQLGTGAPSWTSSITRSQGSPPQPSVLSWSALVLTSSTTLVISSPLECRRSHQRGQVLSHRTDEPARSCRGAAPSTRSRRSSGRRRRTRGRSRGRRAVLVTHSDIRRDVGPVRSAVRVGVGVVRRHHAVDEILVSLVELVVAGGRDVEASLVEGIERRLVVRMNDSKVEAPMMSPAIAKTVSGLASFNAWTASAIEAAPAAELPGSSSSRPWKSLEARICTVSTAGARVGRCRDPDDLRVVVGGAERAVVVEVGGVVPCSGCTRSRPARWR